MDNNKEYSKNEKMRNQKIHEWEKENYDQVTIRIPKGKKNEIKLLASIYGKSVNRIVVDAVNQVYNLDL